MLRLLLLIGFLLAPQAVSRADDTTPSDDAVPTTDDSSSEDQNESAADEPEASDDSVAEEPEQENQYESDSIVVPPATHDEPFMAYSQEKALEYLSKGARAWTQDKQCLSCHTNGTYVFLRPLLTKSVGPPEEDLHDFCCEQLADMQDFDDETLNLGAHPAQLVFVAAGLARYDAQQDPPVVSDESKAAFELMFSIQQENGTWSSVDCWPPFESSEYQVATMASMAIAANATWLESVSDDTTLQQIERLKNYLRTTDAPHDYARVLKLWASLDFPDLLAEGERDQILQMIADHQNPDGGWSIRRFATPETWASGNRAERLNDETELQASSSDGHMTGLALMVQQLCGVDSGSQDIQRGLVWLRQNQRVSGRWWTRSLNTDDWHYITYSGTMYPVLALHLAENQQPGQDVATAKP